MHMVGSLQPHAGPTLLHFDGEFADARGSGESHADRTQLWLGAGPVRSGAWRRSPAVIRGDDGSRPVGEGPYQRLSYGTLFLGTDSRITSDLLIPAADRIDVNTASDEQILKLVAKCISTYMGDLLFPAG